MKVLVLCVNREKFPDPVFPIGASYIAHSVKKAGFEVSIFDACFSSDVEEELKQKLVKYKPDVIGFSIRNVDNISFPIAENYLPYYKDLISVCKKNSTAKIVLGGSGFSIFPELYMEELKADYGVRGEGEHSFVKLLKDIQNNNEPTKKIINSVSIENINLIPDRIGFDVEQYFKFSGCLNIQTKRGCSFSCNYCTYPLLEGTSYRFRTKENVVDEIEYWYNEKGINYFFFVDNVFNFPENFAKSICEEIIRRKLKINWTGFFIPKVDDQEFLDVCIESGLTSIDFGTDAFSTNTLLGYDKSFTVDDIFKACDICNKKNIKFNHSLIFGGPNETIQTLNETIDNINQTNPTSVIGFIGVRLYSGTPLANKIKDIDIGITPVFYISPDVKDVIIDILKEKIMDKPNWIVTGLEKGTNTKLFNRMRNKGIKGPLWEMFTNFSKN
ncbi:MAG: hypothetical protein A2086_16245 [Spirochaetes bacterium GWD1_27_9]|nr:MAG: hypothetical protein A2Z98_13830 [Spirochaetes bacterium GWB1_27_13]OHD24481.1 MAG: hypothetical protein A2Y34_15270 [Spirochaetes bacterium GWC1_27_15]OHD28705.1 MAG: hypothetical protein A2086_16245 [Spirochaetes bacterium GWD1_27_9]